MSCTGTSFALKGATVYTLALDDRGRQRYRMTLGALRPIEFAVDWSAAPEDLPVMLVLDLAARRAIAAATDAAPGWKEAYAPAEARA